MAIAHLPGHVRLAKRGRIEAGGHKKQVLAGAFPLPRLERALRHASRRHFAGEQFVDLGPEVRPSAGRPAEHQLHPVAGFQIGEFGKCGPFPKRGQALGAALAGQRERGQRLAAALPPSCADDAEAL